MLIPRSLAPVVLLSITLAACSQSTGGGSGGSTTAVSVCASDPRATPYAVGLSSKSMDGAVAATFVDAMPAPPAKGDNAWTVKLTDAMGGPISGASVTVKTLMPDHGHSSSIIPQVTPMGDAGVYQVTRLELFMAGIWQVTLNVTPSSGPADAVVFTFCVDG